MSGDEYKELRADIKDVVKEMRAGFKAVAESQSQAALDSQAVGSVIEVQKTKCAARFDDIEPRLEDVEDKVGKHGGVLLKLQGASAYLMGVIVAIFGLAVKAGWV